MANTLLTISMITRGAMRVLENNLVAAKKVRRDLDDNFERSGAKIGTVLNVRKPPRYLGRDGQGLQIEDATETSVPVALNYQSGVDISFSSVDLALNIDDFMERFLDPAIISIANKIDYRVLQQYVNVFNEVGTPGTVPVLTMTYLAAGQKLNEMAAPYGVDQRSMIISPAMEAAIVDAMKGLFNPQALVSRQTETSMMAEYTLGFNFYMDQNSPVFTVGAQGGTPLVSATAGQTGSSVTTTGWTATTNVLNKGDIVTFDGCYAVNPQNRQSTGYLAMWVVTANVTSDGSGNATIPIAGPDGNGIITSGAFQNATASPTASTGVVHVQGAANTSSARGLGFHKDAFVLACADLPLPDGVDRAARVRDKQLGLSIRMVRAYDINTDRWPCRTDILYGPATLYPQLACRVAS